MIFLYLQRVAKDLNSIKKMIFLYSVLRIYIAIQNFSLNIDMLHTHTLKTQLSFLDRYMIVYLYIYFCQVHLFFISKLS